MESGPVSQPLRPASAHVSACQLRKPVFELDARQQKRIVRPGEMQ
jgi:hypothetical protein